MTLDIHSRMFFKLKAPLFNHLTGSTEGLYTATDYNSGIQQNTSSKYILIVECVYEVLIHIKDGSHCEKSVQ